MNGFNNFGAFGMSPNTVPNTGVGGIKVDSWLAPEQIDELERKSEAFNLAITPQEQLRAICNHRNKAGQIKLLDDPDGSCTCTVCGYNFQVVENITKEQVEAACNMVENILQTCKLLYVSLPPEIGREFFQILAFIKKIPGLWAIAVNDYKKYEGVYGYQQQGNANAFSVFNALTTPGGFGIPPQPQMYPGQQPNMYQQPQMFQQPNMYQQPQMYPGQQPYNGQFGNGGVYGNQGTNPFVQGQQPQPSPQPTQQGFAMNPQGAAAPAQPPSDGAVNVAGEFKA